MCNKQALPLKVLIIDDNEIDLFIAAKVLLQCGFTGEILSFQNVEASLEYLEGIRTLRAKLPDLIFLDLIFPSNDALDFIKGYKSIFRDIDQAPSIYLLSASFNPPQKKEILSNSFVKEYLGKPLTREIARRILDEVHSSDKNCLTYGKESSSN